MTDKKKEFLTITLTGRPPVKIRLEDWPILAEASEEDYDNQYEFQANRKAQWWLKVRKHSDGRAIVYGAHSYDTRWQGEKGRSFRAGELLESPDGLPAAIRRVAEDLESRFTEEDTEYGLGVFPRLAHECTADLPAVAI